MGKNFVSLFAALCLSASATQANVVVNGTPGEAGGTVVVTTPITFTIQVAGAMKFFIMDGSVQSYDGTINDAAFQAGTKLSYTINGGVTQTVPLQLLTDNFAVNVGDLTPTDTCFSFDTVNGLIVGDRVTILAQVLPLDSLPAGFNSNAVGAFTGRGFLGNATPLRISDIISVNRATQHAELAVAHYNYYASLGLTNLALSAFHEGMAFSLYYFYFDAEEPAKAEFHLYKSKGMSLKYYHMSRGKPKIGKYFQYLYLGQAYKRMWTIEGDPQKGQALYNLYRRLALAARR